MTKKESSSTEEEMELTETDKQDEEASDEEALSGDDAVPHDDADATEAPEDPVEKLREELRLKEEEVRKEREESLRVRAETENFRKRLTREKEEFVQFANEKLLKELLPIFDNLERALNASNATVESMKQGIEMIRKQVISFLEKHKVESIEAVGEKFDPSLHDAMSQLESHEHEEDTVIQEYSKGYSLNGRVLRPSQVVISKAPAAKTEKSKKKSKEDTAKEPGKE